ncbi:hypothetical protein COO60DRAFT_1143789 [Scenedesmus sp. NREL 46B-D3]|nr:hypothetical protein COO60DRAFT_1143789 [Scenedesmus sp. NREL 46B-D3]
MRQCLCIAQVKTHCMPNGRFSTALFLQLVADVHMLVHFCAAHVLNGSWQANSAVLLSAGHCLSRRRFSSLIAFALVLDIFAHGLSGQPAAQFAGHWCCQALSSVGVAHHVITAVIGVSIGMLNVRMRQSSALESAVGRDRLIWWIAMHFAETVASWLLPALECTSSVKPRYGMLVQDSVHPGVSMHTIHQRGELDHSSFVVCRTYCSTFLFNCSSWVSAAGLARSLLLHISGYQISRKACACVYICISKRDNVKHGQPPARLAHRCRRCQAPATTPWAGQLAHEHTRRFVVCPSHAWVFSGL